MFGTLKKTLVISGALLMAGCAGTAAGGAGDSPQAFVAALYAHYDGKGPGAGIDYGNDAEIDQWFAPGLAALVRADLARGAASNEPPVLDGDPFVNAQEWDVSGVAIAIGKTADPLKSTAMVTFRSMGEAREVRLDLAAGGDGWKIADIDWGDAKMSAILAP